MIKREIDEEVTIEGLMVVFSSLLESCGSINKNKVILINKCKWVGLQMLPNNFYQ